MDANKLHRLLSLYGKVNIEDVEGRYNYCTLYCSNDEEFSCGSGFTKRSALIKVYDELRYYLMIETGGKVNV